VGGGGAPPPPPPGGREVGGSSENFGKVGVATLQPNHEEEPDDPRQDAAFRAA
jgi:hypothetical protein